MDEGAEGPPELLILSLLGLFLAGLAIALWHMRQSRRGEEAVSSLERPAVDAFEAAAAPGAAGASVAAVPDSFRLVTGGAGALPQASRAGPGTPAQGRGSGEAGRGAMTSAVSSYYRVKSRYRNSAFLKGWERDFISHPDLRGINERYQRDRNASAFLAATLRSPNFGRLVRDHAASPQLRSFVMELISSPGVSESGRSILQDPEVMAAARDLQIPGLPPLGQLAALVGDGSDPSKAAAAILGADPALKALLTQQDNQAQGRRRP